MHGKLFANIKKSAEQNFLTKRERGKNSLNLPRKSIARLRSLSLSLAGLGKCKRYYKCTVLLSAILRLYTVVLRCSTILLQDCAEAYSHKRCVKYRRNAFAKLGSIISLAHPRCSFDHIA